MESPPYVCLLKSPWMSRTASRASLLHSPHSNLWGLSGQTRRRDHWVDFEDRMNRRPVWRTWTKSRWQRIERGISSFDKEDRHDAYEESRNASASNIEYTKKKSNMKLLANASNCDVCDCTYARPVCVVVVLDLPFQQLFITYCRHK
jgi:hypothetical protein